MIGHLLVALALGAVAVLAIIKGEPLAGLFLAGGLGGGYVLLQIDRYRHQQQMAELEADMRAFDERSEA